MYIVFVKSTMYIVFVNFNSLTAPCRRVIVFWHNLFSGGSYTSDCLAVFFGVSLPLYYVYVINYNAVFIVFIGQNISR